MAKLTISRTFRAKHGTLQRLFTNYTVQVSVFGDVILGFTNHCDSALLARQVETICSQLENSDLDAQMGRATHEMIAFWFFHRIGMVVDQIAIEGDRMAAIVERKDYLRHRFDSVLYQHKAITAFFKRNLAEAELFSNEAIGCDECNEDAFLIRGRVFRYAGRYAEAAADFRQVIRLAPEWSEGYRNMGNILLLQERYDAMLPFFQKAVRLAPHSSIAANNLGYAYGCAGKWQKAYDYSALALKLNPDYREAHLDIARACEALELHNEAKRHREIAGRQEPNDGECYLSDPEDMLMIVEDNGCH